VKVDVKGFNHPPGSGQAWSWPEFDDYGLILRPAHAWAAAGLTACGEEWPHQHEGRSFLWNSRPGWAQGDPVPSQLAPTRAQQDMIRDGDRWAYLCTACRQALGLGGTPVTTS